MADEDDLVEHILSPTHWWVPHCKPRLPRSSIYKKEPDPAPEQLSANAKLPQNMTTDLFILILPLPVILTLHMTLKRRLAIISVITTGGAAVLTSGLRAIILWEFATSPDFTWSLGKMVIISNVEMQVGILAANMPSLKAFYTCWRKNTLGPGQGVGVGHSSGSGGKDSKRSRDDMEMGSGLETPRSRNKGKVPDPACLTMTESEERLFEDQNGKKAWYQSSMQSAQSARASL